MGRIIGYVIEHDDEDYVSTERSLPSGLVYVREELSPEGPRYSPTGLMWSVLIGTNRAGGGCSVHTFNDKGQAEGIAAMCEEAAQAGLREGRRHGTAPTGTEAGPGESVAGA